MKILVKSLILSLFFITVVWAQFANKEWTISNDSIAYILHSNGSYESVENNPLFSGGIMITGLQDDELAAFLEYPTSRLEGARPGKYDLPPDDPRAGIYVVDIEDSLGSESYIEWNKAVSLGAPYADMDRNGVYNPETDQPLLFGDVQTWMVYSTNLSEWQINSPLALEVQQLNWVYRFGKLKNVLFFKYVVTNKGDAPIDSSLFSLAMDPDIGDYRDDLLGSDSLLFLGYVYNSGEDSDWGSMPPALGAIITSPDSEKLYSVTPIYYSRHEIFPEILVRYYQQGKDDWGQRVDPKDFGVGADQSTNPLYFFSGDPLSGSGWLDNVAYDKKMLTTAFAKVLQPEESIEFYAALVLGKGNSPLNSVSVMKENAAKALQAIRSGFKRADPPPAAGLEAIPGDKSIDLMIDLSDCYDYEEEDVLGNRYLFEGFALYQLAHADAEAGDPEQSRLIARYDLDNLYRIIFGPGDNGEQQLYWSGKNNLSRHIGNSPVIRHQINHDAFSGEPLNNFSTYHFAVKSFSINHATLQEYDLTRTIHDDWFLPRPFDFQYSEATSITVVPGSDVKNEYAGFRTRHTRGTGHGSLNILPLRPAEIPLENYTVSFFDNARYWRIEKNGMILRDSLTVRSFREDALNTFPIIDGMQFRIVDVPDSIAQIDTSGTVWLEPNEFIYPNNGALLAKHVFQDLAVLAKEKHVPVKIYFDTADTSVAYWFRSGSLDFRRFYGEVNSFIRAYDISNPDAPRRLNILFSSVRDEPALIKNNRTAIIVTYSDYNKEDAYPDTSGGVSDAYLTLFLQLRARGDSTFAYKEGAFEMTVTPNYPLSDLDVFNFSTSRFYETELLPDLRSQLASVKAVPNPYFPGQGYNGAVRFINLPQGAVIRIFDVAGRLVRSMTHDSARPYLDWDLRNEANRKVASGIYVVHVTLNNVGQKIFKTALIQEE